MYICSTKTENVSSGLTQKFYNSNSNDLGKFKTFQSCRKVHSFSEYIWCTIDFAFSDEQLNPKSMMSDHSGEKQKLFSDKVLAEN